MEAVRDFRPFQDTDQAAGPAGYAGAGAVAGVIAGVEAALAALRAVSPSAVADAAFWGFRTASGFAGQVEELSRTMEYLQLVAAAAVDRARREAMAEAARGAGNAGWTTGWRETTSGSASGAAAGTADGGVWAPDTTRPAGAAEISGAADGPDHASHPGAAGFADASGAADDSSAADAAGSGDDSGTSGAAIDANAVHDGYRNTAEFLRARLRISAAEARRRLTLAEDLLPRTRFGGHQVLPAAREELGAAVASAEVASQAASIITVALDRVRHVCDPETAARMEHALTRTAAENDPDFLVRVARSWTDAVDQDGAEPSEEQLRQLQGAFIRRPRHGLHHLEIFATAEQFEHLLTVMNTATNPRTTSAAASSPGDDPAESAEPAEPAEPAADAYAAGTMTSGAAAAAGDSAATDGPGAVPDTAAVPGSAGASAAAAGWRISAAAEVTAPEGPGAASGPATAGFPESDPPAVLDLRTRPQKMLDGLVGACKVALTAGSLPAAGGLRPQVMVTIDYRDLLARLDDTPHDAQGYAPAENAPAGNEAAGNEAAGIGPAVNGAAGACGAGGSSAFGPPAGRTGTLLFTGPVTASTARKIACDADIIPVLLGGGGRILDIGRTSRIFPPHIRKALTARDQGCAFPGCTIPAPWCEAHHITYWSRGGSTGTDNGTLLCSHHHHLIHKEQWTIRLQTGVPWFIPPPHLDPRRRPRRNHYFHPTTHPLTA